jgi:glutaredoxin 3
MSADVLIYLTQWCPYCRAAKDLLGDKKVRYTEIDVDDRQDLRKWLVTATGQRTVPQIFINGKSIGGFSDMEALDAAGELDVLLAEAPPAGLEALPR